MNKEEKAVKHTHDYDKGACTRMQLVAGGRMRLFCECGAEYGVYLVKEVMEKKEARNGNK